MRSLAATVCVLLGTGLVWAAEGPAAPAGEEPVRLYTNADLAPLAPLANGVLSVAGARQAPSDAETWKFVGEFLDREASRLDAERAHELERRRAEPDEQVVDHGYYPLSYGYYGYDYGDDTGGRCHDRGRGRKSFHGELGGPIRPIHAGPTQTQLMWAEATRRSGVDAFPSNRRSSERSSHARGHRHSR